MRYKSVIIIFSISSNYQTSITNDFRSLVPELRYTEQREEVVERETGLVAAEPGHRWPPGEGVGNDKRRKRDFASNDLRGSMAVRYGSVFEAWSRAARLHDTPAPATPGSASIGSMFLSGISRRNHAEARQLPQVRWTPIGWCTFRRNMSATADLLEVEAQPRG